MRRLAFLCALAGAATGCGPDGSGGGGGADDGGTIPVPESQYLFEISTLICGLIYDTCDCPAPDPATKQACLDNLEAAWDLYVQMAKAGGLVYNGTCAGKNLDFWSELQCGPLGDAIETSCDGCAIYHGNVQEGQPCTEYGVFSDCAAEFFCTSGVCEDPCGGLPILEEGDACRATDGEPLGLCTGDLWCALDTDECVLLPGVGEPCVDSRCIAGAICDLEATPEPECVAAPGLGDPCPDYACEVGAECDSDTMTCVEAEPFVCQVG